MIIVVHDFGHERLFSRAFLNLESESYNTCMSKKTESKTDQALSTPKAVGQKKTTRNKAKTKARSSNSRASHTSKKPARTTYGWPLTAGLFCLLVGIIMTLWALFISGPARIHEESIEKVKAAITEQVPDIQSLRETEFDFVTWQGYTEDTLYWFDVTGSVITTRELSSLNYNAARQKALDTYNMEVDTVFLAYGYSGPVYQLESENEILMLDYDTLDWVYERGTGYGGSQ